MRITNFNKRTSVAISAAAREQCDEAQRYSLVERVCSFMERYSLVPSDEGIAPSTLTVAILHRSENDHRRRKV